MKSPHFLSSLSAKKRGLVAACAATLVALPASVEGAISIGVQHFPFGVSYPVIHADDLVNTGSPDLQYFASTAFWSPLGVNDGGLVTSYFNEIDGYFPAMTTFYLNTVANPGGYTINTISTITYEDVTVAFGQGGAPTGNQHYKVEYSLVGDSDFITLSTITALGIKQGATQVTLLDIADELTGVDVLRFTWPDPTAGTDDFTWLAEIDVLGVPTTQVPEPSTMLMMLGAVSLLGRRRRKM